MMYLINSLSCISKAFLKTPTAVHHLQLYASAQVGLDTAANDPMPYIINKIGAKKGLIILASSPLFESWKRSCAELPVC